MRGTLVFAAAMLAACGQDDPCASAAGSTCLALEVRWRTRGPTVEQLELEGVRGLTLPPRARTPPTVADPFSLPVVVPLEVGQLAGEFAVVVRALRLGMVVGDGAAMGSVNAGEHRRLVVELTSLEADDAGVDAGAPDLHEIVDFSRDDAMPCAPPTGDEWWVDDDAPEGGTGGVNCPLPTVGEAIELARRSGSAQKRIRLRPGTYSRERFPLMVRDGISLIGEDARTTLIQGSGDWANPDNTAFPSTAEPVKTTIVVGSAAGASNRIEHLTVRPEATLTGPDYQHVGIICDRGTAPSTIGVSPPPASLVIDDVEVGPHYFYGVVATNTFPVVEGCNLLVTNSRFVGGFTGVFAQGALSGKATRVPVSVEIGTASGNGNLFSNSGLIFNDSLGACAIDVFDDVAPLRIRRNQFFTVGCGVRVFAKSALATVEIADNQMRDLRYHGIALAESTRAMVTGNDIRNVDFTLFSLLCVVHPALCIIERAQVVAYNNVLVGNHVGIALRGEGVSTSRVLDFGRNNLPGGNTIACNSRSATDPGHDLDVSLDTDSSSAQAIQMHGNIWNHSPVQQGSGDGSDFYMTGTAILPIVNLASPTVYTQGCPTGRNP